MNDESICTPFEILLRKPTTEFVIFAPLMMQPSLMIESLISVSSIFDGGR